MKTPNFFIVGAPKCGTTAMYDYLKQHPEIFMSEVKEPHFFGTDLTSPQFIREKEKYLSLFSEARDEKRLGEGSVWYLYSKRAATEIKRFYSLAKIIIMLRNPIDMLYSLHSQLLYVGYEDIENFEAALDAENDRKQGARLAVHRYPVETLFYREVAKYKDQVQRYVDVFGWENVKVVIFDDFKSNTARVYQETCEFLGVNPLFGPKFPIINRNKRVRSKTLRDFMDYPPAIARMAARTLMPLPLRQKILRHLKGLNTRYENRLPMAPELRQRLQAEFAPEVEQLSRLLNRDLTQWRAHPNTNSF